VFRVTVLLAAIIAVSACHRASPGPPEIVVDQSVCSRCGMLISEPLYAAAYKAEGQAPRMFDDIGCLRAAARDEDAPIVTWFHDAGDREWIPGAGTVFVASSTFHTPMGGGLIAFRDAAAAQRSALEHRGQVIPSVVDLLKPESAQ
jgi:copper chaperone NosL